MKKNSERLDSAGEIIKQFKNRIKALRGHRSHHLRFKIATAYYLESNASLTSSLLDEQEIHNLLHVARPEVLALQVYIGGWPFKGSGIFEQRAVLSKRPQDMSLAVKPQHLMFSTTEIVSIDPEHVSSLNEDNIRLIITESQHEMIKILTRRVVKQIEKITNCRVIDILLEVVFNSAWTPIVVSARNLRVDNVPPYLESNAEKFALVYVGGEAPVVPPLRERRRKQTLSSYNILASGWGGDGGAGTSMRDVGLGLGAVVGDGDGDAGTTAGGSAQHRAQTMTDQSIIAANSPTRHNDQPKSPNTDTRSPGHIVKHDNSPHKSVNFNVAWGQTTDKNKTFSQFDIPPPDFTRPFAGYAGDESVEPKLDADMLATIKIDDHNKLDHALQANRISSRTRDHLKGDGTDDVFLQVLLQSKGEQPIRKRPLSASINKQTVLNKNPTTGKTLHGFPTSKFPQNSRFLQCTEASKYSLNHFDKLIRARDDLVRKARSSSASHTRLSRPIQQFGHIPAKLHGIEGVTGRRASSFERRSPHLGSTCYGDYCDYLTLYYAEQPPERRVKGSDCRSHLAFKSILLARAEASFLQQDLNQMTSDYMQTLAELRKQSSDADQYLAAFARQHLYQVGKKCEIKARNFLFADCLSTAPEHSSWDKLHAHYRRLVYADALTMVHPSRFYYTIPVCEVCYKIYTYLDSERGSIVLHDPVHNIDKKHNTQLRRMVEASRELTTTDSGFYESVDMLPVDEQFGRCIFNSKQGQYHKGYSGKAFLDSMPAVPEVADDTDELEDDGADENVNTARTEELDEAGSDEVDDDDDETEEGRTAPKRTRDRRPNNGERRGHRAFGAILGPSAPASASDRFRNKMDDDIQGVQQWVPQRGSNRSSMLPVKQVTKTKEGSALLSVSLRNRSPAQPESATEFDTARRNHAVSAEDATHTSEPTDAPKSPKHTSPKHTTGPTTSSAKFVGDIYKAIDAGREGTPSGADFARTREATVVSYAGASGKSHGGWDATEKNISLSKVVRPNSANERRHLSRSLGQSHTDKPNIRRPQSGKSDSGVGSASPWEQSAKTTEANTEVLEDDYTNMAVDVGIFKHQGFLSSWVQMIKPSQSAPNLLQSAGTDGKHGERHCAPLVDNKSTAQRSRSKQANGHIHAEQGYKMIIRESIIKKPYRQLREDRAKGHERGSANENKNSYEEFEVQQVKDIDDIVFNVDGDLEEPAIEFLLTNPSQQYIPFSGFETLPSATGSNPVFEFADAPMYAMDGLGQVSTSGYKTAESITTSAERPLKLSKSVNNVCVERRNRTALEQDIVNKYSYTSLPFTVAPYVKSQRVVEQASIDGKVKSRFRVIQPRAIDIGFDDQGTHESLQPTDLSTLSALRADQPPIASPRDLVQALDDMQASSSRRLSDDMPVNVDTTALILLSEELAEEASREIKESSPIFLPSPEEPISMYKDDDFEATSPRSTYGLNAPELNPVQPC
jgi:hypothetical protein